MNDCEENDLVIGKRIKIEWALVRIKETECKSISLRSTAQFILEGFPAVYLLRDWSGNWLEHGHDGRRYCRFGYTPLAHSSTT
jgi:hypothetical protein